MQEIEQTGEDVKEMKIGFQKMRNNQMNCLTGKLRGSPYNFKTH